MVTVLLILKTSRIVKRIHYTTDNLARMIHTSGVRVSAQRIAVLDFIANKKTHPTADEIYSHLHSDYPSMSKTTVYNSLHVLVDSGLVRLLEIESGVMRYDLGLQEQHGHFLCRKCGSVFDLPLPTDLPMPTDAGFRVDIMEWNCKGLCPDCAAATETNN